MKPIWTALLAITFATSAQAGEICTVISDADSGQTLLQRGDCATRVTPASTFKIPISLIGYDVGYLIDARTPELPFKPGYVDWRENWKQPANPTSWMRDSVVWYSQQVTTFVGLDLMKQYLRRFRYGNEDMSGDTEHDGLTMSWIGSTLEISPLEQTAFLRKLVKRQLNVSARAYDMTAQLLADQPVQNWNVAGKTGSASSYGWYVGWATQGARRLVFAHLLRAEASDPADQPSGLVARERMRAVLAKELR